MVKPARIFTFYAKEDEPFVEQLTAHLSLLRRKGIVKDYFDTEILPSEIWDEQTLLNFAEADMFLFLVSPSLLRSGYYKDDLIQKTFSSVADGKIKIIPVLIRQSNYSQDPLNQFQILPINGLAIESNLWVKPENAWKAVSDGLIEAITGEKQAIPITAPVAHSPASKSGMSWPLQLLLSIVVLAAMGGISYYLVNYEPAKDEAAALNTTNTADSIANVPFIEPEPFPVEPQAEPLKLQEEKITPKKNEKPKTNTLKRPLTKPAKDTIGKEVNKDTAAKPAIPPPPPKAAILKSGELEQMLFDFSQGKGSVSDFAPYLCNKLETTVRFEKKSMSFQEMCAAIKEVKAKKIKKISVMSASYEGSCISNLEVSLKKKLF